jgi:tetratricopeptide (TPR) repeat protein
MRSTTLFFIVAAAVAIMMISPGSVLPGSGPARAQSPAPALVNPTATDVRMAGRLVELARLALTEPQATHPARIAIARSMLQQAVSLNPADAETWRLRMEIAELTEDRAALREALSAYLRLEPRDDAAQLRLIELLADDQQQAEERLSLYRRLIDGPGAAKLSGALRSRVALKAARLAREQGDVPQYGQLLKRAIELDVSHKAAAMEAYVLLEQRGVGPVELTQALINLLATDPTDGQVQARIGAVLLAHGHYDQAVAWYESAGRIWGLSQAPGGEDLLAIANDWAMALWGAGRGGDALKFMDTFMRGLGEGATWPLSLQSLSVAIHASMGQATQAAAGFTALSQTLAQRAEADPSNVDLMTDRVWAHLLFNQSVEQAEPMLASLSEQLGAEHATVRRLRGWWLLRSGKLDEAAAMLEPLAGEDAAAKLGLALATGSEGEERGLRGQRLNEVWQASPGRMMGLLAMDEMRRLEARPQLATHSAAIGRMAAQIPAEFRLVATNPIRFVMFRITPVERAIKYGQTAQMRLELTNTSPIPLSIGPGGAIPTQVMLLPEVRIGNDRRPSQPIIVDMARRLRLEPNESITVTATIDQGMAGVMQWRSSDVPMVVGVTGLLNPVMRGPEPTLGVLGVRNVAAPIQRAALVLSDETIPGLIESMSGADPMVAMGSAAALTRLVMALPADKQAAAEHLAEVLTEVYGRSGTAMRAWILSHSTGKESEVLLAPVIREAVGSDEVVVWQMLLMSQATEGDGPVLTAAMRREGGAIREFAGAWRELLGVLKEGAEGPKSE